MKWFSYSHLKDAFVWLDGSGNVAKRLTYGRLAEEVWKLSDFLANRLGLTVGDRIVLCYPPSLEFLPAFFACLCNGIVAIPVYPPNPVRAKFDCARFLGICDSAAVSHVLTDTMYRRVSKLLPTLARDSRWKRLSWWDSRSIIDKPPTTPTTDLLNYPFPSLSPDSIAFLQYTSGSTGPPKGVMVSSGGLLHNCHLCVASFGFPTVLDDPYVPLESIDDVKVECYEDWFQNIRQPIHMRRTGHPIRVFSWLPVYHDMGLIGFVLVPFLFGGSAYQLSPISFIKKPHLWMECVSKYRCVCSAGPNFAFELSVRKMPDAVYDQLDLSHVCGILCGAEPIRRGTVCRFLNKFGPKGLHHWAFRPAYGLAENTLIVSGPVKYDTAVQVIKILANRLREDGRAECVDAQEITVGQQDDDDDDKEDLSSLKNSTLEELTTLVSCGKRKPGVDIRIVDAQTNTELPEACAGEIWIKSSSLAKGYFGCSEECRRAFNNSLFLINAQGVNTEGTAHQIGGKETDKTDKGGWTRLEEGMSCRSEEGYLRTGDAGFFLNDQLFVIGRIKDVVIVAGQKWRTYFPQDIEAEMDLVPQIRPGCNAAFAVDIYGVESCAVALELCDSVYKQSIGSRLSAFLSGKSRITSMLESIKAEILDRISRKFNLKISAVWLCRSKSLPKTSSGKVRRTIIRELLLANKSLKSDVLLGPSEELMSILKPPAAPRQVRVAHSRVAQLTEFVQTQVERPLSGADSTENDTENELRYYSANRPPPRLELLHIPAATTGPKHLLHHLHSNNSSPHLLSSHDLN